MSNQYVVLILDTDFTPTSEKEIFSLSDLDFNEGQ